MAHGAWTNDEPRNITLPPGGDPSQPHIVIGPDVPATLAVTNFTFTGAVLFYYDANAYYFEASGVYHQPVPPLDIPVFVEGTYDPIQGVLIEHISEDPAFLVGEKHIYYGWPTNGEHTTFTYLDSAVEIGDGTSQVDTLMVNNRPVYGAIEGDINSTLVVDQTLLATFSGMNNTAFNFTKVYDSSQIKAWFNASCYSDAANTRAEFALRVNTVDFPVGQHFLTTANVHQQFSAVQRFGGGGTVPAGTYSVQPRWRRVAGAGTLHTTTDDWISVSLIETV